GRGVSSSPLTGEPGSTEAGISVLSSAGPGRVPPGVRGARGAGDIAGSSESPAGKSAPRGERKLGRSPPRRGRRGGGGPVPRAAWEGVKELEGSSASAPPRASRSKAERRRG